MINKKFTALLLAALIIISAVSLGACSGKEINIDIDDAGSVTQIAAKVGMTVNEVLTEAKITLGEKDETEPEADEKITEDTKEIVVKRYAKVTIVKGSEKKEVELVGGKVKDALEKAKIKLEEGETTDPSEDTYLKDGMTVTIINNSQKVSLTVDGKTTEMSTKALTVEDFLKDAKITLGEFDELNVKKTDKITKGMKIIITRVEYKEETKTEEIDYEIEENYDSSMNAGESKVTQEGKTGEKEVKYKVKYVDGKETSREKISEKVTTKPVTKKITVGTKQNEEQNNNNDDNNNNDNNNSGGNTPTERYEVSREAFPNCDDGSHGYYEIHYSDGSVDYQEY